MFIYVYKFRVIQDLNRELIFIKNKLNYTEF